MSNPGQKDGNVLILLEKEEREIAAITFELLQLGRSLAVETGGTLCAAVLGHQTGEISKHIALFSDEVYSIDSPVLEKFQSDPYIHSLEKLCRHVSPEIILIGHTVNNIDLAPRLAYRMGARLITDCTSIRRDRDTGSLLCTKPVYGDRAHAVFILDGSPKIVTLRAKSIEPMKQGSGEGKMLHLDIAEAIGSTELIRIVPGESVSLDKADVIVAGGRGIKGSEGLTLLGELIETLRKYFNTVELGASRPLADAVLLPKSRQLGQTGEKAAPQLYVAVAISGSTQHVSGIAGSKKIVAINKDGEAPIFDIANYGVVGPYESVVPALIGKLREFS